MDGISSGGLHLKIQPRGADLIVVKLKPAKQNLRQFYQVPEDAIAYQHTDIIQGIEFAIDRAKGRPLIVLCGLGTNMGAHDGTMGLEQYLPTLTQREGVGAFVAAGNEGNKSKHMSAAQRRRPRYCTAISVPTAKARKWSAGGYQPSIP